MSIKMIFMCHLNESYLNYMSFIYIYLNWYLLVTVSRGKTFILEGKNLKKLLAGSAKSHLKIVIITKNCDRHIVSTTFTGNEYAQLT